MKGSFLLSIMLSMAALSSPLSAAKKTVTCGKGPGINQVLGQMQPGDTLTFTGTCTENVVITIPQITITGQSPAVIQSPVNVADALTINGATGVILQNFTVQNGFYGIHAKGSASVTLDGITVQNNALTGILVEGNSSAYINNSTTQNNFLNGIDAENSASLSFSGTFLTQNNAVFGINLGASASASLNSGTITAQGNALGIQVSIDSSMFVGSLGVPGPPPTVQANNNFTVGLTIVSGAHLFGFGSNIVTNGNGLDGIDIASRAGVDFDAASQITSLNNQRDGVHVEELSFVNLFNNPQFSGAQGYTTLQTNGNAANGISLLNNSQLHMFDQAKIIDQNNAAFGIQTDNGSSMTLINSTVQGNPQKDVTLTFGSRGEFSMNTIGTFACDSTSLARGDKTCP